MELQHRDDLPDGAAAWQRNEEGRPRALSYVCPCGCKATGSLPVDPKLGTHWTWDGNEAAPTLSPSILRKTGCGWHGFLTAGQWITC